MDREADFFLTSREHGGDLQITRACWVLRRVKGPYHSQYVWVRVKPALIGQPFGSGSDFTELVLSPHYEGDSLAPLSDFPISVYVYIPERRRLLDKAELMSNDLRLVAWGELYHTETEARQTPAGEAGC